MVYVISWRRSSRVHQLVSLYQVISVGYTGMWLLSTEWGGEVEDLSLGQ
jgi:hypothetical protein